MRVIFVLLMLAVLPCGVTRAQAPAPAASMPAKTVPAASSKPELEARIAEAKKQVEKDREIGRAHV